MKEINSNKMQLFQLFLSPLTFHFIIVGTQEDSKHSRKLTLELTLALAAADQSLIEGENKLSSCFLAADVDQQV